MRRFWVDENQVPEASNPASFTDVDFGLSPGDLVDDFDYEGPFVEVFLFTASELEVHERKIWEAAIERYNQYLDIYPDRDDYSLSIDYDDYKKSLEE